LPSLIYLAEFIRARSGMALGSGKQYLLEARLAPILRRESMTDLDQLANRLAKGECEALARDITEAVATHETLFFRDAKPFNHLLATGLPMLTSRRPPGTKLRLWSAAAATGQEAYSLAITLAEYGLTDRTQAEILGTDLARKPISQAQAGLYSQYEVQRGLSVKRLLRHFTSDGRTWQVNSDLRALCCFREWNLLDDPAPLGQFDVVFCRNVLLYFDQDTRAKVLALIRRRLTPDGLLYLGAAETLLGLDDTLERDGPCYVGAGEQLR
jgi:chemotaxis protein methyltransferase CheR